MKLPFSSFNRAPMNTKWYMLYELDTKTKKSKTRALSSFNMHLFTTIAVFIEICKSNEKIYDVRKHLQANVDGGQCGVSKSILLSLSAGTSEVLSNRLLRSAVGKTHDLRSDL